MYYYKGDISNLQRNPFVVAFSVMIIWPEHAFDVRDFGMGSSEIHFSNFLHHDNGNNKNAEQLLVETCLAVSCSVRIRYVAALSFF